MGREERGVNEEVGRPVAEKRRDFEEELRTGDRESDWGIIPRVTKISIGKR